MNVPAAPEATTAPEPSVRSQVISESYEPPPTVIVTSLPIHGYTHEPSSVLALGS